MTQQPAGWPDNPPPASPPLPASPPAPPAWGEPAAAPPAWGQPAAGLPAWGQPAAAPSAWGQPGAQPGPGSVGQAGSPAGGPAHPVAPIPPDGLWKPVQVRPVAGTAFGVVHLDIAPVTSGLAAGAAIAGVGALIVAFFVLCFGVLGAQDGWGAWVAGAFAMLGLVAGAGGVGLGVAGVRQIRRSGRSGLLRFTGRGPALTGIWCGGIGLGISLLSLVLAVTLQVA